MDLCISSFNLNCIMQLKQFYNIATKVNSRKSATTFGDLLDCSSSKPPATAVHILTKVPRSASSQFIQVVSIVNKSANMSLI